MFKGGSSIKKRSIPGKDKTPPNVGVGFTRDSES